VNIAGQGDGPIHNPDTNSPTIGENPNDPQFGFNDAVGEMVTSPFTPITLTNPGDRIEFTGSVELRGTVNSALTSGTPRTQFRFGLFDGDSDPPDDLGWAGYYMSNKHGNAGTPSGTLAAKPVGNTSTPLSVTGQTTLNSAQGDGTEASRFNDGIYNLSLTVERNAAGELIVNGSILGVGDRPPLEPYDPNSPPPSPGPNVYSHTLVGTHIDAPTLGTYTFDRLVFLTGGNLAADHAAYMNLEVNFISAPAGTPGDFNNDGVVDAADYVIWRKGGPIQNDTDPPGAGPEDYAAFVENFGEVTPPGAGDGGAVPEPATFVLVALALVAGIGRRRCERNSF
jgi:hypothetical protein